MMAPAAAPFAAPLTAAPVAAESILAAASWPAAFGSFLSAAVTPAWSAPHRRHSSSSASCVAASCPLAGNTTMPSFCLASFIVIGFAAAGALLAWVELVVDEDEDFSDDALTTGGSMAAAHSTRAS